MKKIKEWFDEYEPLIIGLLALFLIAKTYFEIIN
jgi:hypothetical protein